ncbi:MAG: phosphatidate cytidylyltransferase, partial [Paracoccaceae bacterium]
MRLAARWHDLGPRVATGLALLSVGALTIWMGGPAFATFIGLALGLMMWELAAMMAPGERLMSYALVPLALCAAVLPMALGWPVLLAALVLGGIITGRERWLFVAVTAAMALASFSLMGLRGSGGAVWVLWLVLVVVATDVAGYFVGRIVGGPLLWKRLSPKKTWSGAAGGWIAAACVGAIFATVTPGSGLVLIVVSVLA